MDESEVIEDESSMWSWFSPIRTSHVAHFPIDLGNSESYDSGSSLAEVNDHERDHQEDQEKPGSSVTELRGYESSPLPAEAKGHHLDDEHQEKTEM